MFMTMGTAHLTFAFEKVFTIAEAAEKLGISTSETYHLIQDGSLSAFRVGRGAVRRHLRVTDEDLERFVRDRRVGPAVPTAVARPVVPKTPAHGRRTRPAEPPGVRPGDFLAELRDMEGRD